MDDPKWMIQSANSHESHGGGEGHHVSGPLARRIGLRADLEEHMHHGRQAIGGAGGVGDHVVLGLVVLRVVHSAHLDSE